jgi:hypothetical protein
MAKSNKKSYVTRNAVADGAEARQVDEKPLLKNGGQMVVEVAGFREAPQFLNDLGSLRCEAEEIGKNSKSLRDAILKV